MKPRFLSIMSCAVVLLVCTYTANAKVAIGKPAPDFSITDAAGNTQTLSQYAGKVVVLEWTNHECPFTVKHYKTGNMQGLQQRYTEQDVVWLSVISSAPGKQGHVSPEQAQELTESRKAEPSAVLLDQQGQLGRLYEAKTTPHMFIVDGDGLLQYNGAIDSIRSADSADIEPATNYVASALDALLANQPVEVSLTKPYGCSVKY